MNVREVRIITDFKQINAEIIFCHISQIKTT